MLEAPQQPISEVDVASTRSFAESMWIMLFYYCIFVDIFLSTVSIL